MFNLETNSIETENKGFGMVEWCDWWGQVNKVWVPQKGSSELEPFFLIKKQNHKISLH